jgi:translation initiation factor 2 subunit 1
MSTEKIVGSGWLLPEAGELVVATIVRILPYGAYASLDEYDDAEGLIHISEISSRWVKNIRNHVREKQKAVLKVLRVDHSKRHINLSLRRVNEREKREKLLEWKREQRGRKLFDMAAEKLGVNREEAYEKVGRNLEDHFESLYASFEDVAMKGEKPLVKANVPSEWIKAMSEIADSRIKISQKKIKGILELTCNRPNGVEVLRASLKKAKDIEKSENADVDIYVIGAPRYRIEVLASNYKEAEKLLEKAVKVALETVEASSGEGEFTRIS